MRKNRGLDKLLAVVLVVALLVGCGTDKNTETEDTQSQQEIQWVSQYGIPEEMGFIEKMVEQDGEEEMADLLELVRHEFGQLKGVCEFDGGVRVEYYADGYKKVYVEQEATQQIPVDSDQEYLLQFIDADGECFSQLSYSGSPMRGSFNDQAGYTKIMINDEGRAVYYLIWSYLQEREPVRVDVVLESDPEGEPVLTLTRDATGIPPEITIKAAEEVEETTSEEAIEENTQLTEATEPAGPVMTTKVLDLAGCTLQEISDVLGKYTLSDTYAWFRDGYVSYVFAYGTDMGSNYVSGALNQLIDHCPETLTLEDVQQYFPGGYTFYDDMDGRDCYGWDYRGCTLVLCMNPEGAFTNMSGFYYNSDALVQQQLQASQGVNEDLFRLPGKTKGEIDSILGESGYFEGQFGCQVYNYKDSYVWVYMDDYENGTCIGFYTPLKNIVNMASAYVQGTDMKSYFGDTYQDPWNGNTAFQTMYKGGQLRIFQNMGDQPDEFGAESAVNFRLAGKEIFPNDGEQVWTNSSALFYGGVTVYSQTASEMVCEMEYYQLTPPNRVAQTGRITLTSNDGITYTASGVMDTWESQMNVTVTMLEEAAKVTFEYTKMGDMANFCFGDFIVYQ